MGTGDGVEKREEVTDNKAAEEASEKKPSSLGNDFSSDQEDVDGALEPFDEEGSESSESEDGGKTKRKKYTLIPPWKLVSCT